MFQVKMALVCSSIYLISVLSFLLWCLKCSTRMLYAGTVICTNPYSVDEYRCGLSVSNGLYDINTNDNLTIW